LRHKAGFQSGLCCGLISGTGYVRRVALGCFLLDELVVNPFGFIKIDWRGCFTAAGQCTATTTIAKIDDVAACNSKNFSVVLFVAAAFSLVEAGASDGIHVILLSKNKA